MEEWGELRREGPKKVPVRRISIVCDVEWMCLSLSVDRFRRSSMGGVLDFGHRDKARRDDWGARSSRSRGDLTASERIGN